VHRQLERVTVDVVFTDVIQRKNQFPSQFYRMMAQMREGDTLVVERIDRLGRSPVEFLNAVRELTKRGVRIECVVEGLYVPAGEDSPLRNLLVLIMDAFNGASQSWISERRREARALTLQTKAPQTKAGPLKSTLEEC
jgi:DNA invertase Pin-like site-specific DNA recombinase